MLHQTCYAAGCWLLAASADACICTSCAGATGLVGSRLVAKLAAGGHSVRVLTRDVGRARAKLPYGRLQFYGQSDWASAIDGATAVVNLAGQHPSCPRVPLRCRSRLPAAICFECSVPVHKAYIKCARVAASALCNWDARPDGTLQLMGLQDCAQYSSCIATSVITPTGGCAS